MVRCTYEQTDRQTDRQTWLTLYTSSEACSGSPRSYNENVCNVHSPKMTHWTILEGNTSLVPKHYFMWPGNKAKATLKGRYAPGPHCLQRTPGIQYRTQIVWW